jgi:hypothetical protein
VVSPGAPSRYKAPADGETFRHYNVAGELWFEDEGHRPHFANNAKRRRWSRESSSRKIRRSEMRSRVRRRGEPSISSSKRQLVGSFGQLQDASGAFKANFDTNYTAISADYPASVPSQVVVQSGETLRHVAARVFGDPALWYVLAEENGLAQTRVRDRDRDLSALRREA